MQAVSRAAERDVMAALFLVGAFTGLRCPGELRALRWAQLDFQNRIVHVVRNYVLGQEGVTRGSACVASRYVALTRAGLGHLREKRDPIIPYDLRHTFGTLAVRTAPLTDVQAWMGHQDIQTTMRYVHYVPRHDAAAKLTAAFDGVSDAKQVPSGYQPERI